MLWRVQTILTFTQLILFETPIYIFIHRHTHTHTHRNPKEIKLWHFSFVLKKTKATVNVYVSKNFWTGFKAECIQMWQIWVGDLKRNSLTLEINRREIYSFCLKMRWQQQEYHHFKNTNVTLTPSEFYGKLILISGWETDWKVFLNFINAQT